MEFAKASAAGLVLLLVFSQIKLLQLSV